MAQKTFKNLSELEAYINAQAKKVLQQDDTNVKNVVVHELVNSIEANVYEAYDSPARHPYQRQKAHGGLTDPNNFAAEPTSDGVAIYSTRSGTDREGDDVYVSEIIEGYKDYSTEDIWGYGYETPRHFVEPAREKLKNSKSLKKAFGLDMNNAGFDVK